MIILLRDEAFAKLVFGDNYENILNQSTRDRVTTCGKLEILSRLLPEWKTQKSKVLIFSKSTRMLDVLGEFLDDLGHSHLRYDGSIQVGPKRQRIINNV